MACIPEERKLWQEKMMAEFIVLKVVTTGEDVEERFNVREPLKVVFNRALQAVGGGANRDQFTLEFQDQPLDLDKRIEDYLQQFGWTDGTILELVPRPEVI
jgi:hypothetical protein